MNPTPLFVLFVNCSVGQKKECHAKAREASTLGSRIMSDDRLNNHRGASYMENYIPRHKSDVQAIKNLRSRVFATIKADVPELLGCMQDMHWDIAQGVAEYLAPHVNEIRGELLFILNSNDEQWKFGIVSFLLAKSPNKLDPELIAVLKRVAEHPTKSESYEELDVKAKEIISQY